MSGRVVSVNVGLPREVAYRGKNVLTSIWKHPVEGRVTIRGVNLQGDEQADLTVHGGPDKAVYAYALEDLQWWEHELKRDLAPGTFGENLTVSGLEVSGALIGARWKVGGAVLEIAQPRVPCFKLGIRMGSQLFVRRFAAAERPGAYLRILQPGHVAAGDVIDVVAQPEHGVTIREVNHALLIDPAGAARLLDAPQLPSELVKWADWQRGRSQ